MASPLVMAIDAGTGSCRAGLFDGGGAQVALVQREWEHATIPEYPGSQVFDPERNWELICRCTAEAVREAADRRIAAVIATSMREGIVLYDANGRELWACPNADARAGDQARGLTKSGDAERIYRVAGDWVSITSPARLLWLREHEPDLLARTAHLTMLSDWVVNRLSGTFVTDPSVGSSSGMFDLIRRTWSPEIIDICQMSAEVFPPVREPGTVVGEVTARAARETGLPEGTPVILGGADTQLGLIGLGSLEPHRFCVLGGTFWQHTVAVADALVDPECRLRTLCHALPGQWMVEGIGFLCGLALRWFRDAFCERERELATVEGRDAYELMEDRAAAVPPGSGGILALFSNVMDSKRWLQGVPGFLQFDITRPASSGRKECIRALMEAAAYVTHAHQQILESLLGLEFGEMMLAGGAAKSRLWPQILADVCGLRVRVPEIAESTALGAARLAAVGAGLRDTIDGGPPPKTRTHAPDPTAHARYRHLADQWMEAYRRSLTLVEDDLLRPLWRATGL